MYQYPGMFLKGMGSRGGSGKDAKTPRKSATRHSSTSDSGLPIEELTELRNILAAMKQSFLLFLKTVFESSSSLDDEMTVKRLHNELGELLDSLKRVVDKYPILATPEIYASVHLLVSYVQSSHNERISMEEMERLINQLVLYFTKSVSLFVVQLKESVEKKIQKVTQSNREPVSSDGIFGVELEKYLSANKLDLPIVVTKCIKEVEKNGIFVKGIYRVSAVKSKVNQLCEAFEKYGNEVNLTDVNPNITANVLKFYLRELPQPLFTFELYPEFIRIAKLFVVDSNEDNKVRCLQELRAVLMKLPKCYYAVVTAVMLHLHRISAESEINNMSPYNLAVIFGPTLLHCLRGNSNTTSRAALFDNVHQIRAIELMITWADELFHE